METNRPRDAPALAQLARFEVAEVARSAASHNMADGQQQQQQQRCLPRWQHDAEFGASSTRLDQRGAVTQQQRRAQT